MTRGLRRTDAVAVVALALWAASLSTVDASTMDSVGLLDALPASFFLAVGLLVLSIALTLHDSRPSPIRFALHVGCLVLVLHGTVPFVLSEPNYPWTYKHVGVTQYVNLHGSVRASIDIYQSWPGFFAVAAWFTKLAGVKDPLAYAAWAPVYFNLLNCLMLSFAFRALAVERAVRWLAIVVFVAGNWIGQDYFAPQALAYVLTLAVFGLLLTCFGADRRGRRLLAIRRVAHRAAARIGPRAALPSTARPTSRSRAPDLSRHEFARLWVAAGGRPARSRSMAGVLRRWQRSGRPDSPALPSGKVHHVARILTLLTMFGVVVVTHQLSPYMLLVGVLLMIASGTVRPQWIVVAFTVEAVVYLLPHLAHLEETQNLFGSLLHPFGNIGLGRAHDSTPELGRHIVSLAAPALVLGLWLLAAVGTVRRLRGGRATLVLGLLTLAPALLALVQSYGGEAVLRIYLFSLPWTALLAASALTLSGRVRGWVRGVFVGVAVTGIVVLFMAAFYGSEELYRVQPGALQASRYFYAHAPPGSVLVLGAPQFPGAVAANYDRFVSRDVMPSLLDDETLLHHKLGAADVMAVTSFVAEHARGSSAYLALTTDQQAYAQVLGLLPHDALRSLGVALTRDRRWRVAYTNSEATIYRYLGGAPAA